MRRVASALLVALALVAGACGGNDNKSTPSAAAGSFADAACIDLAQWAVAVQPAFTDLQSIGSFDASDKAVAKALLDRIVRELDAADQATATLADGIDARPAPDIASGSDIKKAVVDALRQLRTLGKKTRDEIASFDLDTATPDQAAKLKNDLGGVTAEVTNSFAVLAPLLSDNSDLRNALQNAANCRRASSELLGSS